VQPQTFNDCDRIRDGMNLRPLIVNERIGFYRRRATHSRTLLREQHVLLMRS
jgi:hypothetical protein